MSHVSVSIDDAHLPSIGRVAEALREHGMLVEQVLDGVGIITGSVPPERRRTIELVPGVDAVLDGALVHRLPDPGAEIQ